MTCELVDMATSARGRIFAKHWGVPLPAALIALGWMNEDDYVRAAARRLGVGMAGGRRLNPVGSGTLPDGDRALLAVRERGEHRVVVVAAAFAQDALATFIERERARGTEVLLATGAQAEEIRLTRARGAMIEEAVQGLRRLDPQLSAATPTARWQVVALLVATALVAAAFTLAPEAAVTVSLTLLGLPFLCVAVLRLIGLFELVVSVRRDERRAAPRVPDEALPAYSILVPLHDEVDVLPRLVRALTAIDYPAHKLEILLVLEASDKATRAAVAAMDLPATVRPVVVPSRGPRTKPKALNYALGLARGDYVVVYDAEDRPEPDQLRRALARFAQGGADLACVQACLNTYNPRASFLTRGLMAQTPRAVRPLAAHIS